MSSIDIHAHILPARLAELESGSEWHGFTVDKDEAGQVTLTRGSKSLRPLPKLTLPPERRLEEMDSAAVDVHVLSTWTQFYNYDLPTDAGVATSRECNDYVAELTRQWPARFAHLFGNHDLRIARWGTGLDSAGTRGPRHGNQLRRSRSE